MRRSKLSLGEESLLGFHPEGAERMGVCAQGGLPVWREAFEGMPFPWKVNHLPRVRMEFVSEGEGGGFERIFKRCEEWEWELDRPF